MDDPDEEATTPPTPEEIFGAELRRLREEARLTVRQLAEALHRAHSGIVEYERGRRLPAVDVCEQYEDHFRLARGTLVAQRERARALRLERPVDATVDEHLGDAVAPYMGLRAFGVSDAALFFGRESLVEDVSARLAEVRFVAVVGASGGGKSSFVHAGLVGALRAAGSGGAPIPKVVMLTPGARPVHALATAAGVRAVAASDDLPADPGWLARAARRAGAAGCVIVVDQLEELFTLCDDEGQRRCFVDALLTAWREPSSPVAVIVALRADLYGRIAAYPDMASAVVAHQVLVGPMSRGDLRRAIELPAAANGLLVQPGLAQTMLDDLSGEPGSLPLLSHALLETWKRRRRLMLTVGGYLEAGGVRGAIAQTAERTLQALPEADRPIAQAILLRLCDVGEVAEPTRLRVARAALTGHPRTAANRDRVVELLAEARLLTLEQDTVVVAHEALIRHWPRLRGWIEADRAGLVLHRRLTAAAREWHALDRDAGALYRGPRLEAAGEWAGEHARELSATERDFLRASQENEAAERAAAELRARRLRTLAGGLAATTIAVVIVAAWALDQRNDQRRQTREVTSFALAARARSLVDTRPDLAMLLGLAAYHASPRVDARGAVVSAMLAARDPRAVAVMRGHGGPVLDVAMSSDGRTLASAGADRTVRLWDVRTHKQLGAPLTGHSERVLTVAFSPDGGTIASGGADRTIRLWDVRTRARLGEPLEGHSRAVADLAFSLDGRTLASGGADRTIRLWDVRTRLQVGVPLTGSTRQVTRVAFGPDGRTLVSVDQALRLWDVRTHKQLGAPLRSGIAVVPAMAFSPDGRTLAIVGYAGIGIDLWDVRTRRQVGEPLEEPRGALFDLAFAPDGHTLAAATSDGAVQLWDVATRRRLAFLRGHDADVVGVAFGPDGRTLASASSDTTLRLWDISPPQPFAPDDYETRVEIVTFSPDGRRLAASSDDGTIRVWDAMSFQRLGPPLPDPTDRSSSLAFSPDGNTLASASLEGRVRLWDLRTRKQLDPPLVANSHQVHSVAFAPDGRTLATSSADGAIRFWDPRTHRQVGAPMDDNPMADVGGATQRVAFSPDGRILAAATGSAIHLWDVRTRRQIGSPLTGHSKPAGDVAFSPDGHMLASASEDRTVRLWDVRSHEQLGEPIVADTDFVEDVAFAPDGRTLATRGYSADAILLWDVHSHDQLGQLSDNDITTGFHPLAAVAFDPTGRRLAYGSSNGSIGLREGVLWRTAAELDADLCRFVGRGLSRLEWSRYAGGIPFRETC